ncbi:MULTISPECIES: hypothetical protein [Streptomyces]|uniref:hypothetical protein n=1 Tax=Streptomyces TaxID=1883 RepID=UPI0004CD190C|nr:MULTISPECIES: hypothetical protein [Streptomyces]
MSVASSPEPVPTETDMALPSAPRCRGAECHGSVLAETPRTRAPEIASSDITDPPVPCLETAHDCEPPTQDVGDLTEISVRSELGITEAFPNASYLADAFASGPSLVTAITQQNTALHSLFSSVPEALPLWSPPPLPSSVIQAVQAARSSLYIPVPKLQGLTAGLVFPTLNTSVLMGLIKPAEKIAASSAWPALQRSLAPLGEMRRFAFPSVVNGMPALHNHAGLNAIQFMVRKTLAHSERVRHALGAVTSRIAELVSVTSGYLLVAEAKKAYCAYEHGDARPLKEFISKQLRFLDRLDDRCQALALALLTGDWKRSINVSDARAVRRALTRAVREGNDLEGDHQAGKRRIGYHEDRDLDLRVPGPEDLIISQVLPWHETFEDRRVRYTLGKLHPTEREIARAWAENPPIPWNLAPELVGAEAPAGERVRRKVRRLGIEASRRDALLQEEA